MKTFRVFGMALFAIVMSVGLASCAKDENPDDRDFSNEKKLTKMLCLDENGDELEVYTMEYDNNGKIKASSASFDRGVHAWTNQYVWENNGINVDDEDFVLLKDGLVQSVEDVTFAYNSSNRITKYGSMTIDWDSDKVKSISKYGTITYGETCKKGYCPLIPYLIVEYTPLFFAHPELIGARTKQLPTNVAGITISYEFDNEGYISKINLNTGSTMILTWK